MSQHDYVIDNQSAPAARADINAVLQAIATTNSGGTAPVTAYANQIWYDTATNEIKKRNETNSAWIVLGTVDEVGNTFTPNSLLTTAGIAPATLVTNSEGVGSNYNNTTIPTSAAVYDIAAALAANAAAGVVSATTANVLAATAAAGTGAVGTYALLRYTNNTVSSGTFSPGTLLASGLNYANANGGGGTGSAGTWRLMGSVQYGSSTVAAQGTSVFLRVA
jgi:hypothetical protein